MDLQEEEGVGFLRDTFKIEQQNDLVYDEAACVSDYSFSIKLCGDVRT